jgi:hypothetical protein
MAIFDCFSKSFKQHFSEIFQTFTEFNMKLCDFTTVNKILQKPMTFHEISLV